MAAFRRISSLQRAFDAVDDAVDWLARQPEVAVGTIIVTLGGISLSRLLAAYR